MSDDTGTLYERLGGYNAIAAVANDLLSRLRADPQLGRFWAHRGEDGIMREKQLLIDFLCASAGGPMYYRGSRLSALDMVEEAGFEAIAASDADEAIRILESRNDIRAVFTDVHMPGSMDGLRLARVVRNRWPPVALIVTSGRRSVLETDLPPGGRFLDKPYEPAQIEAALRELIC